jgi:hypothetical protein
MGMIGQKFAYREKVRAYGEAVRPVEVTKEGPPRSNKARVCWLDGEYEGLEEWVPKIRLLAPWEGAEALLEVERRMLEAVEVSEEAADEVTWEAASEVFGVLSRLSDPSEEVVLGYKAVEEWDYFTPVDTLSLRHRDLLHCSRLVVHGALVAQRRAPPAAVVETLDVPEDRRLGRRLLGGEAVAVHQLRFQGRDERLGHRVVQRRSGAARRRHGTDPLQALAERESAVYR